MSLKFQKNTPKQLTERLFFHDIINLTHGLLLFLSNKKATHRGIEAHEIPALEKEIKTLQMMLKDHYQMKHKNLDDGSEWLPLKEIKPALSGLLETYLGQKQIPYMISFKQESESLLIYLPVFYRIMNNLIKNMSEAGSTHAQIDLVFEKGSLLIETKNKVEKNMADKKTQSIEGLGLESIRLLALQNGGLFSYEMINNMWSSHISLPLREAVVETRHWAHKKAG